MILKAEDENDDSDLEVRLRLTVCKLAICTYCL